MNELRMRIAKAGVETTKDWILKREARVSVDESTTEREKTSFF